MLSLASPLRIVPLVSLDGNGEPTMCPSLEDPWNLQGNWSPDGTLGDPPTSTHAFAGTMY